MEISVPVNHNFYEEAPIKESALAGAFAVKKTKEKELQRIFSSVFELKLGAPQLEHVKIFECKHRFFEPDEEQLVLKMYSKANFEQEKEYFVQTGLYAGVIYHHGCKVNITTKYGNTFLLRMLNFVNDIYVDNKQTAANINESENPFLFIIAHLFIQSLEKEAVLGVPQQYKKQQERSCKVRGGIDYNEYLKKDIPFKGMLTSNFNERVYVQEIIDVLYLSLQKLEKNFGKEIHNRLLGISQLLKQHYSGRYASYEVIQKAKTHQSMNSPMYSGFKKTIEYAEIILLNKNILPDSDKSKLSTTGYLFDIAGLFELYLEKLLRKNFPEWVVSGQEEIPIYQQQLFYKRSMYPDLVMKHKSTGKIVVFDAKFKKMEFINRDVDRLDLHQIHSYSGFYRNNLITSGLIYPLSKSTDIGKAYSKSMYGNDENNSLFIIDGIFVYETQTMTELIDEESRFINRILPKLTLSI